MGGHYPSAFLITFMSMEIRPFDIVSARECLKPVLPQAHKGTQGHALLIGGSHGKMGAIMLSAMAALRAGSGLVTGLIPECGDTAFQTVVPEAMTITSGHRFIENFKYGVKPDAIGVGPGLGTGNTCAAALKNLLLSKVPPLVLDADALNIIAQNPGMMETVPPLTVLTPHAGEFQRLFGAPPTVGNGLEFSRRYNIVLVMKGAPTHIFSPEAATVNTTGNAALATGGSGDVLTGIITGLLAQGHNQMQAAQLGVFVHGLAADIGDALIYSPRHH